MSPGVASNARVHSGERGRQTGLQDVAPWCYGGLSALSTLPAQRGRRFSGQRSGHLLRLRAAQRERALRQWSGVPACGSVGTSMQVPICRQAASTLGSPQRGYSALRTVTWEVLTKDPTGHGHSPGCWQAIQT